MDKLFIYGTLMDPKTRKELLRKEFKTTKDSLIGYGSSEIEIEGELFPCLDKIPGKSTQGLIIHGLTSADFVVLDEYETDAYKRDIVDLNSGLRSYVYLKNKK